MTLTLVSVGLSSHLDLSLRAIEAAKSAHHVYAEEYTMRLDTTVETLEATIGRPVTPLPRGGMEEDASRLLEAAENSDIAILVGGDALAATTHLSLLVDAARRSIPVKVVHGSSVFTAIAESGLSLYKFGRTVTVPMPEKGPVDTVLRTLKENAEYGLHTLLLLDLDVPAGRYLTVPEAITRLEKTGEFPLDTLVVAAARLGSDSQIIRADAALNLKDADYGGPPYALVVPGQLHFLEEEALQVMAGCPPGLLEGRRVQGELDRLVEKYVKGCRRVLEVIKVAELPSELTGEAVTGLLDHARRYLEDADYYRVEQKPVALASVAYAEGVLDALKLLGLADFQW
ncbi:diphthine synthase [Candidatus Bathyarchaeota archaeon RBG_13_60_20]|nr:MAG: diphthine synthase [Candidatus Bathyarchaeota archaeon RBG_13_60_20]